MKKLIVSIIVSLVASVTVAQTNQYPNTAGTITKSGYTYKYDSPKYGEMTSTHFIQLHNASVSYLNKDLANSDGTPMTEADYFNELPYYSGRSMTDEAVDALIRGKFTAAQKAAFAVRGKAMIIEVRINPLTGRVSDVYFKFLRTDPATNIPVETYRSIELDLKEKFTITVTANGRKKNFIPFSWVPEF